MMNDSILTKTSFPVFVLIKQGFWLRLINYHQFTGAQINRNQIISAHIKENLPGTHQHTQVTAFVSFGKTWRQIRALGDTTLYPTTCALVQLHGALRIYKSNASTEGDTSMILSASSLFSDFAGVELEGSL